MLITKYNQIFLLIKYMFYKDQYLYEIWYEHMLMFRLNPPRYPFT